MTLGALSARGLNPVLPLCHIRGYAITHGPVVAATACRKSIGGGCRLDWESNLRFMRPGFGGRCWD